MYGRARNCLHVAVQRFLSCPSPAMLEGNTTQCRGGEDHSLPSHVVHGVWEVAEVAHGGHVALDSHLSVVPVCGEVHMANVKKLVTTTADHTGGDLVQAAHGVRHHYSVVRRHPVVGLVLDLQGGQKSPPTVH